MKTIAKLLLRVANHGVIYLYALLFPVYWEQDIYFKQSGYDILSIKRGQRSYFRGTVRQCRSTFS